MPVSFLKVRCYEHLELPDPQLLIMLFDILWCRESLLSSPSPWCSIVRWIVFFYDLHPAKVISVLTVHGNPIFNTFNEIEKDSESPCFLAFLRIRGILSFSDERQCSINVFGEQPQGCSPLFYSLSSLFFFACRTADFPQPTSSAVFRIVYPSSRYLYIRS